MHLLENGLLRVKVKTEGAELTSIYSETTGLEYLWQADPLYWGRHAPLLFPIVGKLKDNSYTFKGRSYQLTQHGFARDEKFELVERSEKQLTFLLTHNDALLRKYPFLFKLFIIYSLDKDKIIITWGVENAGDEHMYFSIGAHPAFNCPLKAGENYSDYYLEFEHEENAERLLIKEGYLSDIREQALDDSDCLPLTHELFNEDALIFSDMDSTFVSLKNHKNKHGVKLGFSGFPYLGIWAKPSADFVCIEPWFGITDKQNSNGRLEEKPGILTLEPNDNFSCSYYIQIF